MEQNQETEENKTRPDKSKTTAKLIWLLGLACILSVIADLFYHKHVHYDAEDWIPGMYGWYSLIGCGVMVLVANFLRKILSRKENYYNEAEDD
ncbi:MAG: hypothetical protein CMM53_08960 [Rhodospirillaceae bacterium]|nr:hypothetical protein [Rhodospirillaceae bacterium]|tara:strand:+ start:268 stop:546 length:279 start_codon:yes stop_codon:yes gene_type:complete